MKRTGRIGAGLAGLLCLVLAAAAGPAAGAEGKDPFKATACPDCKTARPAGAKFCPQCGFKYPEGGDRMCPRCKKLLPPETTFCPEDGERAVLFKLEEDARKKPKLLILVRERQWDETKKDWIEETVAAANDWNRSEGLVRKFFFDQGYPITDLDEAKKSLERGMDFYKLRGDDRAASALALKLECEVVVKGEVRIKKFKEEQEGFDWEKARVEVDLSAVQTGAATVLAPLSARSEVNDEIRPTEVEETVLRRHFPGFSDTILKNFKKDEGKGQEIHVHVDNFSSARTFERIVDFVKKEIENVSEMKEVESTDIGKGSRGSFTVFYKGKYENFDKRITDREAFKTFRLVKVKDAGNEYFYTVEESP